MSHSLHTQQFSPIAIIIIIIVLILACFVYFMLNKREKQKNESDSTEYHSDTWNYSNANNITNELRHRQSYSTNNNLPSTGITLPRPFPNDRNIGNIDDNYQRHYGEVNQSQPLHTFPPHHHPILAKKYQQQPQQQHIHPLAVQNIYQQSKSNLPPPNPIVYNSIEHSKQHTEDNGAVRVKPNGAEGAILKESLTDGVKFSKPLVQLPSAVIHVQSDNRNNLPDGNPSKAIPLEKLYPPPPLPDNKPQQQQQQQQANGLHGDSLVYESKESSVIISEQVAYADKTQTIATSTPNRNFPTGSVTLLHMNDIKMVQVIGGGAFGQVWKGVWQSTPVAVKVLSAMCQSQVPDSVLQAFTDEVQIIARLRHPNICLFLGACMDPPNRAIVTELVSRGSLWEALRNPTLFQRKDDDLFFWPWWVIKRVLDGTCRGLVYLHSNKPPVLHRDLKSANLLLDDSFNVKICDFGLARLRDMNAVMTANVGTAQWTAPEVLAGLAYGEPADMYSVGVILWEMLTGKCPYEDLTGHMQIVIHVVQNKGRPPIPPQAPEPLKQLLENCWSDVPAKRVSAAQALVLLENMSS